MNRKLRTGSLVIRISTENSNKLELLRMHRRETKDDLLSRLFKLYACRMTNTAEKL